MTPQEAHQIGSDYIVVGRPITRVCRSSSSYRAIKDGIDRWLEKYIKQSLTDPSVIKIVWKSLSYQLWLYSEFVCWGWRRARCLHWSEKVREPLEYFEGELVAVIHRQDDVEDKWVLTLSTEIVTLEDIKEKTYFWNNILIPLLNYYKGEIMTLAKIYCAWLTENWGCLLEAGKSLSLGLSGIKSPIYTDNRVTLAYPETRTLIENGFIERKSKLNFQK